MIIKMHICIDEKNIMSKFSLDQYDNKLIISSIDYKNKIIKVPVYNSFNGVDYISICFPLTMIIINKKVLNPFIILASYNLKNNNDIDFFKCLEDFIIEKYNYSFICFDEILSEQYKNLNFLKIINENYDGIFELENLKFNHSRLDIFINNLWLMIILIKVGTIYSLIKYPMLSNKNLKEIVKKNNYPKKIITYSNQLKNTKFFLNFNLSHPYCFNDYFNSNFLDPIKLADLKLNTYYYIIINKNDITNDSNITLTDYNSTNKVVKIYVEKINKNMISLNESKNILYENYKWYHLHPSLNINKDYIIYQTFINYQFTIEIIKNILCIDTIHCEKILDYYVKDDKLSNLVIVQNIYDELKEKLNDLEILKANSYDNAFFEYITKKYSSVENQQIYVILEILFSNYNYPLKTNRHEIDNVFDNLLYFSLYNYKHILINTKTNGFSNYSNEILQPNINSIIPIKVKNLYINLLKFMSQVINNDFDAITYNQKFYNDYLHRNIIKLIFSDTNSLFINLFKSLTSQSNFIHFKNIVSTNLLLIDITSKLTWNNLPKKLNYLNVFYKNDSFIYYQDKINKNIIPENFDVRIKKVIENPFEMYRYIRKDKDFEKWTKFISNKILQLYHIPISLSSEDFTHIGKMVYLLFNITEQNTKEQSYINFIDFCNTHNKLVLDSNRINIKIRECFPYLKANINLGFLAKHLTWDKGSITFDENTNKEKSSDVLELEMKLHIATKKYYKYKAKYLESKDIDVCCALVAYSENQKKLESDTSSIIPSKICL
jgi:hypothetical protein